MSKFCVVCGKQLIGKQRKLCSDEKCHRESKKEQRQIYYQNNRDGILNYGFKYYQDHREKRIEYQRGYRQDNPEKVKEYLSRYYRRSCGLPEDSDLVKESNIEVIIEKWLQESDIEFEQQYFINFEGKSWTRVDFYIPEVNMCLYVDGNYWHSLPGIQERDTKINKTLEEKGYNVIRMTEAEILEGNRPWELKS